MSKTKNKATSIGGQALIEGIMMRGPQKTVLACRLPDGEISTESLTESHVRDKHKILGVPVIRGAVNFIESMIFGYKALMVSAERSGMLDDEDETKPEVEKAETISENADFSVEIENTAKAENAESPVENCTAKAENAESLVKNENTVEAEKSIENKRKNSGSEEKESGFLMGVIGAFSVVLGVALAVFLFMFLPTLVFNQINRLTGDSVLHYKALLEGTMKIAIFVGYISLVSLMKDIKRVFMYHGAEHKSIFCYESGMELNVENVRKQSRFHPRCGTSFLVLMLLVGIMFYALLLILFPSLANHTMIWVALKLILLPIICGLGYELIKFCGRHNNLLTRIISAPGMWVQRITTREPDDSMIEVAISALTAVIPVNGEDDKW